MRSKMAPTPEKGDRRRVKKFAWFDTPTKGGVKVWLEFYYEVQEWRRHGFFHYNDWFLHHSEHICRPHGVSYRRYSSPCICGRVALSSHKGQLMWSAEPEGR